MPMAPPARREDHQAREPACKVRYVRGTSKNTSKPAGGCVCVEDICIYIRELQNVENGFETESRARVVYDRRLPDYEF